MNIWTDGGCHPNPGPGGWGFVRCDGYEEFGGDVETTNNRMEMTAILNAMIKLPDGADVTIHSDSQYCVKGLTTWRNGWRKKNWMKQGAPMINRDLWLELEAHVSRLRVNFQWVRGHNGNRMNERADALATIGRQSLVNNNAVAVDKASLIEKEIALSIAEVKARISHLENIFNRYVVAKNGR